jgi:cyclopropane-fatty-acyl-phospholipid synthase
MSQFTETLIHLAEKRAIPDFLLRKGIKKLCRLRLEEEYRPTLEEESMAHQKYIEQLKSGPLAVNTEEANTQHYEVPARFYELVLGKNLKYSSAYFKTKHESLDRAEDEALLQTTEHAELIDGQKILELGCGWGSLTLWMAAHFPNSTITAISNSRTQRLHILSQAEKRGLKNISVITHNLANPIDLPENHFDRVVSVEMMEHFKNYKVLFGNISRWLKTDGKLFVHIFTHQKYAYPFEAEGETNWMGRHFFTGGQMPSQPLLLSFQDDLKIEKLWTWDGTHYGFTADRWLENQDRHEAEILALFEKEHSPAEARILNQRWRMFFMSCSELFHYSSGKEWGVSHYLFQKGKK